MVQPGGPSNHCLRSSGFVKASKTKLRGASKTRVIAISRSALALTCSAAAFFIGDLLIVWHVWFFCDWSSFRRAGHQDAENFAPKAGDTSPTKCRVAATVPAAGHKFAAAHRPGHRPGLRC